MGDLLGVVDALGWFGAFLILAAYFLLTHHELDSKSEVYQFMNLIGAGFIGVSALSKLAFPSFTVNVVWVLIAIYGLYKIELHRMKVKKKKKIKK